MHVRHAGCRCAAATVVVASTALAPAAPAMPTSWTATRSRCCSRSAQPSVKALMPNLIRSRTDGWYFLEDEAENIVFASINSFCPQHQGLFFQYGFVYGD